MNTRTTVEILDNSLNRLCVVKNLYPINNRGTVLRYSKELSRWGTCTFRVQTKDPLFDQVGDVLIPHQYHVRVKRGTTTVWFGAIVDNTIRNRNYIEVVAAEYEFYFSKKRINQNTSAPPSWQGGNDEGWRNYRNFESGTMATAVTDIVTEAIAGWGSQHILGSMTIGTVDNPNYPPTFTDANDVPLTGGWTFSADVSLQFDYHSVEYVLQAFGAYTGADYYIDEDLVFNFKTFVGNDKQYELAFVYGTTGNIVDYNLPRLGRRMANDIMGIAADDIGNVLHVAQRDSTSIDTYGLMEETSAFTDVKSQNMLQVRLAEELRFLKEPSDAPVNVVLNEKGYPLGQYGIGDIVTVRIEDYIISYNQPRRIVGITINVHDTGREMVYIQTNKPRDDQYGAVTIV